MVAHASFLVTFDRQYAVSEIDQLEGTPGSVQNVHHSLRSPGHAAFGNVAAYSLCTDVSTVDPIGIKVLSLHKINNTRHTEAEMSLVSQRSW